MAASANGAGTIPQQASPRPSWCGLRLAAPLAGGFLALGMLGIKLAVTKGPAGPATAIAGSNAILVTLLDLLVFRHWPPAAKVIGMILALAGIAILAAGGQRRPGDEKPKRHPWE